MYTGKKRDERKTRKRKNDDSRNTDRSSDPVPPPEPKPRRGRPRKSTAVVDKNPAIRIRNACQRVRARPNSSESKSDIVIISELSASQ